MELIDLSADGGHLMLLRRFYHELYEGEFPDPDERESLANMERYLELKGQGWYGRNNYHILIAREGSAIVGGSISDYSREANAGIIEFLVVAGDNRGRGLGGWLLEQTHECLKADARQWAGAELDFVVAEMNDPFKRARVPDNLDPFVRAGIWDRWGYRRLRFPYVQPALSEEQGAVRNLLLIGKAFSPTCQESLSAGQVGSIVHEYLRLAMRIEEPDGCREFQEMQRYLDARESVEWQRLATYVGRDEDHALVTREVAGGADPDLEAWREIYREAFPPGPTTVPEELIGRSSHVPDTIADGSAWHRWAIRGTADGPVGGLASFFTFPASGFAGYLAFGRALRGSGRLRALVARIEEQMIHDRPEPRGWYVECEGVEEKAAFERVGFRAVAVTYRQPPLSMLDGCGVESAPLLALLYKEFGDTYGPPPLPQEEFLCALEWIFRAVYGIQSPRQSPYFMDVARQLPGGPGSAVPFC